ncbi:MAG: hypothetical protein LBR47_06730 [Spirochaetaceae bacterium]|nr:hypothetical protein [Spirochaetaceae bacterium]
MQTTYRLNTDELTENFIDILKRSYPDKEIEITVQEMEDETEYLMKSEVNRQHLFEAIEEVRQGKVGHIMTMEELEKFEI